MPLGGIPPSNPSEEGVQARRACSKRGEHVPSEESIGEHVPSEESMLRPRFLNAYTVRV